MSISRRGAVRHPQFEQKLARLQEKFPRAEEVIAGAEWSISHRPDQDGIRLADYDVWQARLDGGAALPPVLLLYTFNSRYVYMLTIIAVVDEVLFE